MCKKLVDGYYISAYCSIDPLGNILSTGLRHDQNISLWLLKGNKLTLCHHWELERITGIKHHNIAFFSKDDFNVFLNNILYDYGLTIDNIVEIIGIKGESTYESNNFELSYHSLCHLFASMCTNSNKFYNEDILGLSLDAGPDFELEMDEKNKKYYSGVYSQNGICNFFEISSPGIMWATVADYFHMPEGTLMALAYASESVSYESFENIKIITRDDTINAKVYINKIIETIMNYTDKDIGVKFNFYDKDFSIEDNKISMIMKIIQQLSIGMVENTLNELIDRYNIDTTKTCIALSGGYSLNCPTNTYIMHKYNFKEQLMLPCTNDSGQAIGIGIKYFYDNISNFDIIIDNAYYGNVSKEIDEKLIEFIDYVTIGFDKFVEDIEQNPLVWFCGRAEMGPRALGHRSILADPRNIKSKKMLNIIKQREWWRPVAPIILDSECESWFENSFSSPYMLNNFVVKEQKRDQITSILHIDNTARVQTVNRTNDNLYVVLEMFYKNTGVPILCNTSLNDKNEPIIDNINQAINFALRKKIPIIYYENQRIKLKNFEKYKHSSPLRRWDELFTKYKLDKSISSKINPYNLKKDEYFLYRTMTEFSDLDLTNEKDMKLLKGIMDKIDLIH